MSITIRPTGEAQAAAQAGKQIGQAEAAKRQQEIAFQQQAQEAAKQWELQKMLLNSQQEFAHEQRMRQVQLEAEARAHEWEIQKMEIRSKMDFEQSEKERQQKIASINAQLTQLDKAEKSGMFDKDLMANTRLELELEKANAVAGNQANTTQIPSKARNQMTLSQTRQQLEALVGGGDFAKEFSFQELVDQARQVNPEATRNILGEKPPQLTGEQVRVISPEGITGTLDKAELDLPQYQGYTILGFQGGRGGQFGGTGTTGEWTPESKFPFRNVGSIADWYAELTKKRGSIADLLGTE